jgi:hypothetical protein
MLTRCSGLFDGPSLGRNCEGINVNAMMVPDVVVELHGGIKYPVEISNVRVCNGIWFSIRKMIQC